VSTYAENSYGVQEKIKERFKITVNDDVDSHLGVTMTDLADDSIKLSQPKLMQLIFDDYPPEEIRRYKGIPVPLHVSDGVSQDKNETEIGESEDFMHLLGMLNY
jgi:hypothetical protein